MLKILRVVIIGAVCFLIWFIANYTNYYNFSIKKVKITASSYDHIDEKTLTYIVEPYISDGFFHLNAVALKKELLRLPWIYDALIKKQWPDTIEVYVIEQKPILQWNADGLINFVGDFFSPPIETFPKDLPQIVSDYGFKPDIISTYRNLQLCFNELDLNITKIVFSKYGYVEITLNNNMLIYFKEKDLLDQVKFFLVLYKKIMLNRNDQPKYIDLRYSNGGVAVKW